MKVILFGASGMVGQGVLRECLIDPDVETILLIGRAVSGRGGGKIREIVRADVGDLAPLENEISGYDACFFCMGVSAAGMSESDYRRITFDLTLSAARTLAACNPSMTFIYVSGTGTDSTERGRMAWARVKGATENALLQLPFKAAYMFRPGGIRPMHGERPKAKVSRIAFNVLGPLLGLIQAIAPKYVTTTERMGVAMLKAVRYGAPKQVLENADINALSSR